MISVLVPAYRAATTVGAAVASALNQTYRDLEVIVVDDGSDDETPERLSELAASDARVRVVTHPENRGLLEARRTGVAHARGEQLLFLDADDLLDVSYLADLAADESARGRVDILQTGIGLIDAESLDAGEREQLEEFLAPFEGEARGDDVLHVIFRDRRAPWAMWGKLVDAGLARRAYELIPEGRRITQAEDALAMFVMCALADSWRGVPQIGGYRYDARGGSSHAFASICQSGRCVRVLRELAAAGALGAGCEEDLARLEGLLLDETVGHLLDAGPWSGLPGRFDQAAGHWDAADLIGRLAATFENDEARLLDGLEGAETLAHASDRAPKDRVATFYFGLGTGGAERVTLDLARLWHDMGKQVLILCDEGGADGADICEGIEVIELPSSHGCAGGGYGTRAHALEAALANFDPDCFVTGGWLSPVLAWDLLVAKACGVPTVVLAHGSHRILVGYGNHRDLRLPAVLRHADAMMTLSEEDRAFWSVFCPLTYRTINQVDRRFLEGDAAGLDGHTMLWVGRISQDKSPLEAFEVLARVRERVPDVSLRMVGPFGDVSREECERVVHELGLEGAVSFEGGVASRDMPALLRTGDLLLFTSHFEGYPVALAEAKAAGLPCVMYDLDWLTLIEGRRGVSCAELGDVAGLARAATELLLDDGLRHKLGREARAHIGELAEFDFSGLWERVLRDARAVGSAERAALVAGRRIAEILDAVGADLGATRKDRDEKYDELLRAMRERDELRHELACVTGSVSFKAGRALTGPLRALRDVRGRGSDRRP